MLLDDSLPHCHAVRAQVRSACSPRNQPHTALDAGLSPALTPSFAHVQVEVTYCGHVQAVKVPTFMPVWQAKGVVCAAYGEQTQLHSAWGGSLLHTSIPVACCAHDSAWCLACTCVRGLCGLAHAVFCV